MSTRLLRIPPFQEFDQQLIDRFGPRWVIAAKWGVPLVWAFSRDDVAAVMTERG